MATKEINDGIDRAFEYPPLVVELLDTPEVQRTEHIANNGLCHKAFPSIKHDRKVHLIGVAKMAIKTFDALNRNGSGLPETFSYILQALAITHDVGHPPFAHALREVMTELSGYTHEDISARIVKGDLSFVGYFSKHPHLLGEEIFVNAILDEYSRIPSIPAVLDKYGVNPDLVARVLSPTIAGADISPQNAFLKGLIDGHLIDIDKMDYLPRDSRAANVPEGYADPSRILNGLKVVNVGESRHLAVVDTSLDDLCRWVSARKYMYQNVYTHKTILRYEAMLTEAVKQSMGYFAENNIEIHLLTDGELLHLLMHSNPVSSKLAMAVMYGRPFTYHEAYSIKSRKVSPGNEHFRQIQALHEYISSCGNEAKFPKDCVRDKIISIVKVNHNIELQTPDVLVYFPYSPVSREAWKKKLDLYVYSHANPSVVCSLADMAEGTAQLVDIKASEVYDELCKPQSSTYFAVYCPNKYRDVVANAARTFLDEICPAQS